MVKCMKSTTPPTLSSRQSPKSHTYIYSSLNMSVAKFVYDVTYAFWHLPFDQLTHPISQCHRADGACPKWVNELEQLVGVHSLHAEADRSAFPCQPECSKTNPFIPLYVMYARPHQAESLANGFIEHIQTNLHI